MRLTFICFAIMTFLLNCSSDTELKKSVFIHDEELPDLPKYSEWGYNTFGALYGRQVFISNDKDVPLNVVYHDNKTSLEFRGQLGASSYYSSSGIPFSMTLTLPDFHPESYADFVELDNTIIDLTDPTYEVKIDNAGAVSTAQVISGQFHIKRAQFLLVDDNPEEIIISGLFEFQIIVDEHPISLSEGRFDVGIGTTNFFKY